MPGLGGLATAILLVLSNLIQGVLPPAGAPAPELAGFLAANRDRILVAIFIRLFAGLAFVAFIAALQATLDRDARRGRFLGAAAFAGGMVVLAGNVGASATLAGAAYHSEVSPSIPLMGALVTATHFFYVCSGVGLSCLLIAAFAALAGTRFMPMWLGWLGVATAVADLALPPIAFGTEVYVSGTILLAKLGWIAVISVLLFRRRDEPNDQARVGGNEDVGGIPPPHH
jgi:hypothetical protein